MVGGAGLALSDELLVLTLATGGLFSVFSDVFADAARGIDVVLRATTRGLAESRFGKTVAARAGARRAGSFLFGEIAVRCFLTATDASCPATLFSVPLAEDSVARELVRVGIMGRITRGRTVGLARMVPLSDIFALSGGRVNASSSPGVDKGLLCPVSDSASDAVDTSGSVRVPNPES